MRHLADRLGVEVPPARWPTLVEAAAFASMRARADQLASDERLGLFTSESAFFRSGQVGQWRESSATTISPPTTPWYGRWLAPNS